MNGNDKKKNIVIMSLLIIIIFLILVIVKIIIFDTPKLNQPQVDETTTTTIISNKNSIFSLNYINGKYEDFIRYEDISNYKSMNILPINKKLEILDTNLLNKTIKNDFFELYLKIKDGKITDNNDTICDLSDTNYISYKYFDDGILFYGYVINGDNVDLYECKIVAKEKANRELLYSFNVNEYDTDLYELNNKILLKNKNKSYYNIYDNMMFPESKNIINVYEAIMITKEGNVYFDFSKLIGNFDLKSIYYITSNCDLPSSILITTNDNKLILSKYGADYKVYEQIKDIYYLDEYLNEIYLEFLNGKTEKLFFDC